MDSEANKDDVSQEDIVKAYERMANRATGPTVPTPPGDAEDSDDDTETTDDPEKAVEEITCEECGHGPGAYPDDALDQFTRNTDGEQVHYGCR